jgi:catechol 2,3-dioxygenase-like lactoylglutathione lyase family enzyme
MSLNGPEGGFAKLVPELDVSSLADSLRFWCDGLGFTIAYARPESGFAYLEREGAQVMLCEMDGDWQTGTLERPFGRGINFQIKASNLEPILTALAALGWPRFRDVHDAWYRTGTVERGNRQFLVQDPDGYLLRFFQDLGQRPVQK